MGLAVGPSETGERREAAPFPAAERLAAPSPLGRAGRYRMRSGPLHLPLEDCRLLLERLGPSLALWRAAEVAALREQAITSPVLDLGCGDGLVAALALRGESIAYGVDPNPRQIARAMHECAYERLLPQRMETIAPRVLPPGSVGTVLSNSVLEHLRQPEETLRAVARALGPGGRFTFTTPSEAFSEWLALPSARYATWRNDQLAHRALWGPDRWAEALADAGLTLEVTRPYLRHHLVALWDALELAQMVWVGGRRLVSLAWRRLSPGALDTLAHRLAQTDLGAYGVGGGRLYVARKAEG